MDTRFNIGRNIACNFRFLLQQHCVEKLRCVAWLATSIDCAPCFRILITIEDHRKIIQETNVRDKKMFCTNAWFSNTLVLFSTIFPSVIVFQPLLFQLGSLCSSSHVCVIRALLCDIESARGALKHQHTFEVQRLELAL